MTSLKREITMLKTQNPHAWIYRNRLFMLFLIKVLIIEFIVAIIIFFLRDYIEGMILVWIILGIVAPLIILKPYKLFKAQWVGKIEKISYVQRILSSDAAVHRKIWQRTFIECLVIDEKNKTHLFECEKCYERIYKVGDSVINIIGFYYPINLTPNNTTFCPKRGTIMPSCNDHCTECGLQTIKIQVTSD